MTILRNSAKASQRTTKNLNVFLLTYALLGLLALAGLIYRAGAAPVRAEVTTADAPAPSPGPLLPALQPPTQITTPPTLSPLDVVVVFDVSGSTEDQTICHDCWVRTSYNPNWPNNGYFNPIPYNKVWKDTAPGGPGATGNQSIPDSALCTTYPPQPYLDSGFQYLTVEAELYSRNGGDWHLDARVPGQGFWVIQRGSKRSGNNTSVAGNNLQNGTPTPGEDNDQRNATGDPTQQSSNVCRPNAGGIDCTVGGSNDDICSSADGGIAADCSAYIQTRPFLTYGQIPGSLPRLNGAAYNADCFSGGALSGTCWSGNPFNRIPGLEQGPSNVSYVEYDFTPSWNDNTYIWIRAIGGGLESYTWAGTSPDEIAPDFNGGGVDNNITPWRKVIYWQVDNGNINQRKDNMNSDYSNSPTDNGSRYFQPALLQLGNLTWRDNRAINDSWRWIKLGSTATVSGTQSTLKLFQGSAGYKVDKIVFTNDSSGSTPAAGTTITSTVPAVLLQRSDGSITSTTSGEAIGPPASPGSATREACNVCNPIYGYTVDPSQCSCKRTANDTANGGYGSGVGCTLLPTTTNLLQAELQTGLYSGLQPIRSAQGAVKNFTRQLDPQFDQLGFVPFVASQDNTDAQSDPNRRAKLQCLAWAAQNQGNPASCYDPNLGTPISFTQVISAVERQWPESGGNTAIGLREGLEELGVSTPGNLVTNHCTPTVNDAYACDRGGVARKVLILMTDGIPNANPGNCADDDGLGGRPDLWDGLVGTEDADFECAMYYAYLAAQNSVSVYTIGIGSGPDPDLLTAMATGIDPVREFEDMFMFNAQCGQYFAAAKPTDIASALTAVLAHARNCVPNAPSLALTQSDSPDPVQPAEMLTYLLTVTNTGALSATGAILTNTLDSNVSFVSASDGGLHNSGLVTWNVGTILPSQTITRSLVVTVGNVINGTTLTNTISISSAENLNSSRIITTKVFTQAAPSSISNYLPIILKQ